MAAVADERRLSEAARLPAGELLDRLWSWRGWGPFGLPLERGRPASFLLFRPAPEGRIDPAASELAGVWLDGVEPRPAP